ncbi:MAG: ABC transporter ATP-binding protein [Proteobacteria bacterium]|nr:ABC transporter ATP-binding protein [Pseudomonadota bacterium]
MIRVEHLSKQYGAALAIDNIDFHIEKGEIVGFLGPNGAGKTTTMRILAGSLGASSGRALIGGHDVAKQPRQVKRIVGYQPEFPPLYLDMTVASYLRFCARIKGAAKPHQAVDEVVERVGLRDVKKRLLAHLSKGYRQRVALAQALIHHPAVLILDEPASGLDPVQRVEIRQLVKTLAGGDTTILLSTHVLPEVEAVCNRVLIIHNGRIVAENTVEELSESGRSVTVRVARPNDQVLPILRSIPGVIEARREDRGRFVLQANEDIREETATAMVHFGLLELTSERALEDVFLKLTAES